MLDVSLARAVVLTLVCLPAAAQETWVVDLQGGGDFMGIQDALDFPQVLSGDTVLVHPGTYVENINFQGKDVVLASLEGPEQTVIDGSSSTTVVTFVNGESRSAVLDGFTVTNGYAWDGGGIASWNPAGGVTSPTIRNCVIENNVGSGGGGGAFIRDGSPLFENCLIQGNSTEVYHGAAVVIFDNGAPHFEGCTIRDNEANGAGGAFHLWAETPLRLTNCILSGNLPRSMDGYDGLALAEYSICEGDTAEPWFGTGCVDSDPYFADMGSGYAPLSYIAAGQAVDSPGIDAGDPSVFPAGSTRTDSSPDCGRLDIGYHSATIYLYENYCLAAWNSTGQSARMTACGTSSLSSNDLVLSVAATPPGQFGLFFYGAGQDFILVGDGAICIKPPLVRVYPVLLTDSAGTASLALDLTAPPFSGGAGQIAPNETWHFQFWFRDPTGGPAGFNFSNGLAVTFCP
jgi:hypothetical protein